MSVWELIDQPTKPLPADEVCPPQLGPDEPDLRPRHKGGRLKRGKLGKELKRLIRSCEACGWEPSDRLRSATTKWSTLIHAHHVVPISCHGEDEQWNIALLCPTCHAIAHALGRMVRRGDVGADWIGPTTKAALFTQLQDARKDENQQKSTTTLDVSSRQHSLRSMLGERFGLSRDCSQGILSPSFEEVSPEQTATKGPTHSAYVHGSAWASQSALPRTLPRANGLQVPATARTYSSILPPTECERSGDLSVHVPKRPTRNALACQSHVRGGAE